MEAVSVLFEEADDSIVDSSNPFSERVNLVVHEWLARSIHLPSATHRFGRFRRSTCLSGDDAGSNFDSHEFVCQPGPISNGRLRTATPVSWNEYFVGHRGS